MSETMELFDPYIQIVRRLQPVGLIGRVSSVRGLKVGVSDFPAAMGASCRIVGDGRSVDARVIGFAGKQALAMPIGPMTGIARGDRVVMTSSQQTLAVGAGLLGRMIDGLGRCIDGAGPVHLDSRVPIWPEPIPPMQRRAICEPLTSGVRAIDALMTVGHGQRMGLFASSGVGKTVLMGMIARYAQADVKVIALIGERGREVGDFLHKQLDEPARRQSVVVAATSDEPPLVRVQAGAVAAAVAEYFRDQGCRVLLLVDSLTRLAAAQRQIGLVAGEPPATRGYTPSVFSLLPELLERCGRTQTGAITGFYSVLLEGDDPVDPVSDAVRAVTDGHIFLSRELAGRAEYPAVDVVRSVSRVMTDVVEPAHRSAAQELRKCLGLYRHIEELVNIGAYQAGANSDYDVAIKFMPSIRRLLAQAVEERADFQQTRQALLRLHEQIQAERKRLAGGPPPAAGPAR